MSSRRQFLAAGAAAAVSCVGNLSTVIGCEDQVMRSSSDDRLSRLTASTSAHRLGFACLRSLTRNGHPTSDLAQIVIADLGWDTNYDSERMLKKAVRYRIRRDFEESKIIEVDGWFLSLTETRIYAIAFSAAA